MISIVSLLYTLLMNINAKDIATTEVSRKYQTYLSNGLINVE